MGDYCKYCDRRCFVQRAYPTEHGWQYTLMATCTRGQQHDYQLLGYDYTTALNPITDPRFQDDRAPEAMARMIADVLAHGRKAELPFSTITWPDLSSMVLIELKGPDGEIAKNFRVRIEEIVPSEEDVDTATLVDLLSMVEVTVTSADVETWAPEQRMQAADWASATHLAASDNDVTVPPRPAFLSGGPATHTVGSWQAEALRAHLVSEHANAAAFDLSLAEANEEHLHEHQGPGTIRNHPPDSLRSDPEKVRSVLAEAGQPYPPVGPEYQRQLDLDRKMLAGEQSGSSHVDVIFDKMPDPYTPVRFIECEVQGGMSVNHDWVQRPSGTWALRIPTCPHGVTSAVVTPSLQWHDAKTDPPSRAESRMLIWLAGKLRGGAEDVWAGTWNGVDGFRVWNGDPCPDVERWAYMDYPPHPHDAASQEQPVPGPSAAAAAMNTLQPIHFVDQVAEKSYVLPLDITDEMVNAAFTATGGRKYPNARELMKAHLAAALAAVTPEQIDGLIERTTSETS